MSKWIHSWGVACPSSLKYVDVVFVALQCAGGDGEGHNIPARRGGFMQRAPSSLLWMGLDGGREIVLGTLRMRRASLFYIDLGLDFWQICL